MLSKSVIPFFCLYLCSGPKRSEDSSAKIPVFDGIQKGFMMWWVRFHAFAVMRGFACALKEDPSMPENDTVIPADEEAKMVKKANKVAMASLMMACKTDAIRL